MIGETNADIIALDDRNTHADHITHAVKVHLQVISRSINLQKEIDTKTYIFNRLFGHFCPLIRAFEQHLVPFLDENFAAFKRQVDSNEKCTKFVYDLSQVRSIILQ